MTTNLTFGEIAFLFIIAAILMICLLAFVSCGSSRGRARSGGRRFSSSSDSSHSFFDVSPSSSWGDGGSSSCGGGDGGGCGGGD